MNFKRFNGTAWEAVPHRLYGIGSEQLTSFPARIQAAGEPLTDYTIYGSAGGVGERSENLYDWHDGYVHLYPDLSTRKILLSGGEASSFIIPVEPSTTYSYSIFYSPQYTGYRVALTSSYPAQGDTCIAIDTSSWTRTDRLWNQFETTPDTHYALIMFVNGTTQGITERSKTVTVWKGSSDAYIPPYKIPVTSGGVVTNLYLDARLGAGDTLSYADTGIAIPTSDGVNTISFGTTVQPGAMNVQFRGWHPVQSAKQYQNGAWQ